MEAFSTRLREKTATLHKIAERAGFNAVLFKGDMTRELYTRYLLYKYRVYDALESALDAHASDAALSRLVFPALRRKERLAGDLRQIGGPQWDSGPPLSSVASYTWHIEDLSKSKPVLLLAHAYTMYLADLSGGAIIRKVLEDKYGYAESALQAYSFPQIEDVAAFREEYRRTLGEIAGEADIEDKLIEEAKLAYIFSTVILVELVT